MLFALRQPPTLLGLVLGFAAGCMLRATLQRAFVGGLRSVAGAWHPSRWLDPYGAVAALIGGVGWPPRPALSRFRQRQVWAMLAAALLAHAVLAAAGLAGYLAAGGSRAVFPFISTIGIIHGTAVPDAVSQQVALGFGIENLACAVFALLPLPPLELGVALWSTLPKTPGARRLAYHLLEEQWSVAIVLVLLFVPLAGEQPAFLQLVATISDDVLHAI